MESTKESTGRLTDKQNLGIYSDINRKEIVAHGIMWMNLEDIVVSAIS